MPEFALPLTCHRTTPTAPVRRLTASVERAADGWLRFRYAVEGAVDRIALPEPIAPRHTDGLWRHTCFEAFITAEDSQTYVECNFAPSGAWATYRFARYRTGMAAVLPVESPRLALQRAPDSLVLDAQLQLGDFTDRPWRIGLTAVIEDTAGGLSYWALRHPRAKPDFHHRGGFRLHLAAPATLITENES